MADSRSDLVEADHERTLDGRIGGGRRGVDRGDIYWATHLSRGEVGEGSEGRLRERLRLWTQRGGRERLVKVVAADWGGRLALQLHPRT